MVVALEIRFLSRPDSAATINATRAWAGDPIRINNSHNSCEVILHIQNVHICALLPISIHLYVMGTGSRTPS